MISASYQGSGGFEGEAASIKLRVLALWDVQDGDSPVRLTVSVDTPWGEEDGWHVNAAPLVRTSGSAHPVTYATEGSVLFRNRHSRGESRVSISLTLSHAERDGSAVEFEGTWVEEGEVPPGSYPFSCEISLSRRAAR